MIEEGGSIAGSNDFRQGNKEIGEAIEYKQCQVEEHPEFAAMAIGFIQKSQNKLIITIGMAKDTIFLNIDPLLISISYLLPTMQKPPDTPF